MRNRNPTFTLSSSGKIKSLFEKMGGTGYQPVYGGNLPPKNRRAP
jgi:hypothetical protein